MARKANDISSLIGLIVGLIGLVIIFIGYSITFLEKINKYHLWKNFWFTFPFLVIANYIGYTLINTNSDIAISLFIISWLIFIIYWACCFEHRIAQEREEIQVEKDKIINQLGVITPNCPHCGEFIYVRTSPINNKTYLIQEDDIQELEVQWRKKK